MKDLDGYEIKKKIYINVGADDPVCPYYEGFSKK